MATKTAQAAVATQGSKAGQISQATSELTAAAWQAIGKLADKQANRDMLVDGGAYPVAVQIKATVAGEVAVDVVGQVNLTVDHPTTSASSTGPSQAHLLAVLLGKLNRQTRDKILREMADEYAANGCQLPEVADELTSAADELLKKLRKAEKVTKRGAVRAVFQIANVEG